MNAKMNAYKFQVTYVPDIRHSPTGESKTYEKTVKDYTYHNALVQIYIDPESIAADLLTLTTADGKTHTPNTPGTFDIERPTA